MIKVGLIGAGRISKRHIESIRNNENYKLQAVCDTNLERAQKLGSEQKVAYYTDFNKMLKEQNIDLVSVLTESGTHASIAMEVAKYGKNIILEKPLALDLNDADNLIYQCDKYGVKLFVVKQLRFNKAIMKLKDAIKKGRFGKLVLGSFHVLWCRDQSYYDMDAWRGTWKLDGGVFSQQAIHHIDLLQWLMGPVRSVIAKTKRLLLDIEAEDTGVAIFKFDNDALGVVEATVCARPKNLEATFYILGEKGSAVISGSNVNKITKWQFINPLPEDENVFEEHSEEIENIYGWGHNRYYQHVYECIRDNKKGLIGGVEGRRSLELVNAIYESSISGKEIYTKFNPKLSRLGK